MLAVTQETLSLKFLYNRHSYKKRVVWDMSAQEFTQYDGCDACQKEKIKWFSHKSKTKSSITLPLQLIHMNLYGPVNVMSLGKMRYALVMVDDFSRYIWVVFLQSKDEK